MAAKRFLFPTAAIATLLLAASYASASAIYRCDTASGVVFADTPCSDGARSVELDDRLLGGTLDGGLGAATDAAAAPAASEPAALSLLPSLPAMSSPCRVFQSTDLRSHLIREEVVRGLTQAQVRKAWGAPSASYADPIAMWTYDNTYYGRLLSITRVYFEDGCVSSVQRVKP